MDEGSKTVAFEDLDLNKNLLEAIRNMGYKKPSTIQEKVIPHILSGSDLIAQAKTGSGKTAAFGLPSIQRIENKKDISLLVITPTRELSQQVCQELNNFGSCSSFKALAVYGGESVSLQLSRIRKGGIRAIVATPGRLLDLLKSKKLQNFDPSIVVLDEADEMLDMGFLEDIQSIFSFFKKDRQTLFFSATMPKPIQNLANKLLKDPITVNVVQGATSHTDISEIYYLAKEKDKDLAFLRLLDMHNPLKSLVFCKTKRDVDRLNSSLISQGFSARCLHGDMAQKERQSAILAFREGKCEILVATDVAGRGLNILDISHVFNYHVPFSTESYTHRIGRTGRAGRKGVAISLLSPSEFRQMLGMRRLNKKEIDVRPIPSLSDLRELQQENLIRRIIAQGEHLNCKKLLEKLQSDMDLYQIGLNLLSILLEEKKFIGPEVIGMNLEDIQEGNDRKRKFRRKPFNKFNVSMKSKKASPWRRQKGLRKQMRFSG